MKTEGGIKSVGDYAGLFRRRWRYPALIIPAGMLIALFLAYVLPVRRKDRFEAASWRCGDINRPRRHEMWHLDGAAESETNSSRASGNKLLG